MNNEWEQTNSKMCWIFQLRIILNCFGFDFIRLEYFTSWKYNQWKMKNENSSLNNKCLVRTNNQRKKMDKKPLYEKIQLNMQPKKDQYAMAGGPKK